MGLIYSRGSTEKQTSKTFANPRAEISFEAEPTPKDECCVEYITDDSDVEEIIASFLTDDDTALSLRLSSTILCTSSSNTFLSSDTSLNCSEQLSTTNELLNNRIEANEFSIPEEHLHRTEFSSATDLSRDRSKQSECSIYATEATENTHACTEEEYSLSQQASRLETGRSSSSTNSSCKTSVSSSESSEQNSSIHKSSLNTCGEMKEHNPSVFHQAESSIDSDTLSDTSGTIPHAKRKRNTQNIKEYITRNKNGVNYEKVN
ncbi:hypothetical protein Ddc_08471 [Ditylenchus destructor]|nr:hypothetical protein Ddc_08471 [Ditylenchus destructor]